MGADAAGGFGDRDFGNAGKERRWLTAGESPAVAGSPWVPLWMAARPCRCGREESGRGGGGGGGSSCNTIFIFSLMIVKTFIVEKVPVLCTFNAFYAFATPELESVPSPH